MLRPEVTGQPVLCSTLTRMHAHMQCSTIDGAFSNCSTLSGPCEIAACLWAECSSLAVQAGIFEPAPTAENALADTWGAHSCIQVLLCMVRCLAHTPTLANCQHLEESESGPHPQSHMKFLLLIIGWKCNMEQYDYILCAMVLKTPKSPARLLHELMEQPCSGQSWWWLSATA